MIRFQSIINKNLNGISIDTNESLYSFNSNFSVTSGSPSINLKVCLGLTQNKLFSLKNTIYQIIMDNLCKSSC